MVSPSSKKKGAWHRLSNKALTFENHPFLLGRSGAGVIDPFWAAGTISPLGVLASGDGVNTNDIGLACGSAVGVEKAIPSFFVAGVPGVASDK